MNVDLLTHAPGIERQKDKTEDCVFSSMGCKGSHSRRICDTISLLCQEGNKTDIIIHWNTDVENPESVVLPVEESRNCGSAYDNAKLPHKCLQPLHAIQPVRQHITRTPPSYYVGLYEIVYWIVGAPKHYNECRGPFVEQHTDKATTSAQ